MNGGPWDFELTDEEVRAKYGPDVVVTRFPLPVRSVHPDGPAPARRARTEVDALDARLLALDAAILTERQLVWTRRRRALGLPTEARFMPADLTTAALARSTEQRRGRSVERGANVPAGSFWFDEPGRRPALIRRDSGHVIRR